MRRFAAILLFAPALAAAQKVAVDVGHYLEEPGVVSAHGRPELEFNRDLARDIAAALERRGRETQLIGMDGRLARLTDRTREARGAALFLSVHHDSVQEHFLLPWEYEGIPRLYAPDRFAGFSLFVSRKSVSLRQSLACASAIGAALRVAGFTPSRYHAERIPGENKPFADEANGVHYYDNLIVLKSASQPALLFEAGVVVNRDEELRVARPETRTALARAVAKGIDVCMARTAKARFDQAADPR